MIFRKFDSKFEKFYNLQISKQNKLIFDQLQLRQGQFDQGKSKIMILRFQDLYLRSWDSKTFNKAYYLSFI